MSDMTAQEVQRVQTILRKEDPAVSKHMQKVEDLTSQTTNRNARSASYRRRNATNGEIYTETQKKV